MIWSKWVKDSTNSKTMACIGQSALPISSEFLLYGQVWRWLISLNTMQTLHNTRVRPVLAHTRLWTSSLITDMTRRNFLGTFLTSDIWIQFNQIFMSSDAHYQDILQTNWSQCVRRLFSARWDYFTPRFIKTFCKSPHLTTRPHYSIQFAGSQQINAPAEA